MFLNIISGIIGGAAVISDIDITTIGESDAEDGGNSENEEIVRTVASTPKRKGNIMVTPNSVHFCIYFAIVISNIKYAWVVSWWT